MLQKCSFLLLTFVTVSLGQCVPQTFHSTTVQIIQNGKRSTQMIDGCITPKHLIYKPGEDLRIVLVGAHVPAFQKGAISNIQEKLWFFFLDCNIEIIKEGAFSNLPRLYSVRINSSNLNTIEPENLQNMSYLVTIVLENNKIEYFSEVTFDHLPSLHIINLCRNRLRYFTQRWFNKTPNLRFLLLANNLITNIAGSAFNTLPKLVVLDLSGNLINTIHRKAFKGLNELLHLNLSNNELKVLDSKIYSPLTVLNLQFNNITFISDETLLLTPKDSDFHMNVASNPLQCSCFEKMLRWSADNNITLLWECKDVNPVCVIPKTNEFLCIERTDDDFYEGYHLHFSKDCK